VEDKIKKMNRKSDKRKNSSAENEELKEKLKIKQEENARLKKELLEIGRQFSDLQNTLEHTTRSHLETAEVSVDLLYDLEYYKYKSSFLDLDIKLLPGNKKALKSYGKIIRKFFLENLRCTYLYIRCSGINGEANDLLCITSKKNHPEISEYQNDSCRVYFENLVDVDMPERKLGSMVVGREPYHDRVKEFRINKKIEEEIFFTKRILENCLIKIQNKELAVQDALTGLNTRKLLEEKLSQEFNSLNIFTKLNRTGAGVLNTVMKADGKPFNVIRNQYYSDYKTKDEGEFSKSLAELVDRGLVSKNREKHLGEKVDFYYFENSKIEYNLFVAMFDLDHFKDINDNWGGHAVGDRVLKDFSAILKNNIRTTDIPIRYGGEEFIIIFPRAQSHFKIREILEGIRAQCENRLIVEYKGNIRNITVSIGLTQISKYDKNIQQIVKRVDDALYRAKKTRNRIISYGLDKKGYTNLYPAN